MAKDTLMRKLGLALSFLASLGLSLWAWVPIPTHAQGVGPATVIYCNKTATLTGVAVITQVVAAIAGQAISICGWHVTASVAGTFQLFYGTGANCVTGNTALTPAFNVSAQAPSADHTDYAHIGVPAGNALCVTPSATTVQVLVYYSQG